MTLCMYRDTQQLYIIDLTQRGCHTLRLCVTELFTHTHTHTHFLAYRCLSANHAGVTQFSANINA